MDGKNYAKWFDYSFGPVVAILTFLFTYWLDPLGYGEENVATTIPAFLLSIIILFIEHGRIVSKEAKKSAEISDRVYEAVKNYLHVIRIGSPSKAMEYINTRISALSEIKNTSFNMKTEIERSNEKFYKEEHYDNFQKLIIKYASKSLLCKEIGDEHALKRFRHIIKNIERENRDSRYKYKLLSHNEPQINFIILEYRDGLKEVLFNWDFRGLGQDPIVLLSRDEKIVEMFYIHFNNLWLNASPDFDTTKELR